MVWTSCRLSVYIGIPLLGPVSPHNDITMLGRQFVSVGKPLRKCDRYQKLIRYKSLTFGSKLLIYSHVKFFNLFLFNTFYLVSKSKEKYGRKLLFSVQSLLTELIKLPLRLDILRNNVKECFYYFFFQSLNILIHRNKFISKI